MAATGIDGGIDGGNAAGSSPAPPPPAGPVPVTPFALLVEAMDRAAFAHLGAIPVYYQPASGTAVTITGMVDALFALAQGSPQAGVEVLVPEVFFRVSVLPQDPDIDRPTLTIGGIDYRVTERKRDDMGGIMLMLRKKT